MTVTFDRNGDLLISGKGKLPLKQGAHFVVTKEKGRTVLRPTAKLPRRKAYLTPPPLRRSVLKSAYAEPDSDWDKVEDAAVSRSRSSLRGWKLEEL